ncbi:hypothetical protein OH77DRAFT_1100869 [Trametes cingulata]|nr:hypothetical protein OH77DRAFT_1100869 [Trametes cingulata]
MMSVVCCLLSRFGSWLEQLGRAISLWKPFVDGAPVVLGAVSVGWAFAINGSMEGHMPAPGLCCYGRVLRSRMALNCRMLKALPMGDSRNHRARVLTHHYLHGRRGQRYVPQNRTGLSIGVPERRLEGLRSSSVARSYEPESIWNLRFSGLCERPSAVTARRHGRQPQEAGSSEVSPWIAPNPCAVSARRVFSGSGSLSVWFDRVPTCAGHVACFKLDPGSSPAQFIEVRLRPEYLALRNLNHVVERPAAGREKGAPRHEGCVLLPRLAGPGALGCGAGRASGAGASSGRF